MDKSEAYEVVQTLERSEEIAQIIIDSSRNGETVLGVDCEGILRGRPLCLIQVFFENCTYVYDLLEFDPFSGLLRDVLESKKIIKVFHDFCEDAASLITHYGVRAECVFDTQIAHRLLANTINPNKCSENNSISLNSVLKTHLEIFNEYKDCMSRKLNDDITLWEKRPLTDEMINYSIQDVCFLPELYKVFLEKVEKFSSLIEFDLISNVFKDSRKCNTYAYININCKNLMSCKVGQYLTAFLKNFQKFCIYCSLNLGCTGIILDSQSLKFIKTYFRMGDMLNLEIKRIDIEDKKIVLTVPDYYLQMDPETISYYCFYAKSQNDQKLTREYINIYYNKNQAESAPKTTLKLTSRKFFGTSYFKRERGYSDNSSSIQTGLDPAITRPLKNSESTDKLQNILEEQKSALPHTSSPPSYHSNTSTPERTPKKKKIKSILDTLDSTGFTEVPKPKRYFPKGSQGMKMRKNGGKSRKKSMRY